MDSGIDLAIGVPLDATREQTCLFFLHELEWEKLAAVRVNAPLFSVLPVKRRSGTLVA